MTPPTRSLNKGVDYLLSGSESPNMNLSHFSAETRGVVAPESFDQNIIQGDMASGNKGKKWSLAPNDFSHKPIKIIVGNSQASTEFWVTKVSITHQSNHMQRACNGFWVEGQSNTIDLRDDESDTIDADLFSIFLTYVYTGDISNSTVWEEVTGDGDPAPRISEVDKTGIVCSRTRLLVRCYIMGDYLGAEAFRNVVMDHLFHIRQHKAEGVTEQGYKKRLWDLRLGKIFGALDNAATGIKAIDFIWKNTTPGCKLRAFIVGNVALTDTFLSDMGLPDQGGESSFSEFTFEVAKAAIENFNKAKTRMYNVDIDWLYQHIACEYHDHDGYPKNYNCAVVSSS
ncbi:hypothetical protein B0O99DRAFT_689932 [Bisporella sp. PMI_857]|nr:hypothetical protein B0O99DRAFT_689932 [Bisporella sp. PMI_857]